jgi:hypothetical protein
MTLLTAPALITITLYCISISPLFLLRLADAVCLVSSVMGLGGPFYNLSLTLSRTRVYAGCEVNAPLTLCLQKSCPIIKYSGLGDMDKGVMMPR